MSATVQATGNLGKAPELRYTPQGKAVVDLNISATYTRFDKNTGQWVDQGKPLWITATFWEQAAEQVNAMQLDKGARVSVTGILTFDQYTGQDGNTWIKHGLVGCRFLGVVPRTQQGDRWHATQSSAPQARQPQPVQPQPGQATWNPPANDPWATPTNPDDAPF